MTTFRDGSKNHDPRRRTLPKRPSLTPRVVVALGAAAILAGTFLPWDDIAGYTATGIDLPMTAFASDNIVDVFPDKGLVRTPEGGYEEYKAPFFGSAGFVTILLGLSAFVGLALRNRWVIRIAGLLAVAAFGLFALSLERESPAGATLVDTPGFDDLQWGAWLVLLAGVALALAGGYVKDGGPLRKTSAASTSPPATTP